MQVVKTTIHPEYSNSDGNNVDYDVAIHQLATASVKLPARINLGVVRPASPKRWQLHAPGAASCR